MSHFFLGVPYKWSVQNCNSRRPSKKKRRNEAVYHLRLSTHLIPGGRWQILSSYPTIQNSDSLLPLPLLTPPPRCDAAARPGVHARPYLGGTRYTAGHPPRRTVRNPEQIPVADRRTQLDAARPLQRTTNRRNRRWCTTICPSGGPVRMWHTSGAVQRREQYHQALSQQLSPQMSHRERTTCPCAGQKCEQYHREPKKSTTGAGNARRARHHLPPRESNVALQP